MRKLIGFTILIVLALAASICRSEVPQLINYQGMLITSGEQLQDTTLSMTFAIYPDSQGTNNLWSETQTGVRVEDGIFNVLLGSINPIPDTVFAGEVRYLGVKVGGDPELSPRAAMVSMAYAYRSKRSDQASIAENANMLDGKQVGNADGNIPVNNGVLNTNLNADYLDGNDSQSFLSSVNQVIRDTMSFTHLMGSATKVFSPSIDPDKAVVLLDDPSPIAGFAVFALYPDSITIGAYFDDFGSAVVGFQIIEYK